MDDSNDATARPWSALHGDPAASARPGSADPDAPAVLLLTSGTTGQPKFVAHSLSTLMQIAERGAYLDQQAGQVLAFFLPMVHVSGLSTFLAGLRLGLRLVMCDADPDSILDTVEKHRCDYLLALPATATLLMQVQRRQPRDVSSLRLCLAAGDACPPGQQDAFQALFGRPLLSFWASTEAMGSFTYGLHPGAVSRLTPETRMRLVDGHGAQVPRGEPGEMLLRGSNVMLGYWRAPGVINRLEDGWYHSGDLVRQDSEGNVWFVTRLKDLIVRGGSNISPAEVERAIATHPAVQEAAVVGMADAVLGQRVMGFVQLRDAAGSDVLPDILARISVQLADYKVPEGLLPIAALPRNALGKIDRQRLAAMAEEMLAASPPGCTNALPQTSARSETETASPGPQGKGAQAAFVTLTIRELEADPHGVFRQYRPLTSVIAREDGCYMVLRSADVEQLVRDSRVRQSETEFARMQGITEGALFDMFRFSMLTSNGHAHRRRRSPFTRTFAAQMIAAMRPSIRQAAGALIDEWHGDREVDLVARYAALVPARIISAMLGLPSEDIPHFTQLVYNVSRIFSFTYSPDQLEDIREAARELHDYVDALLVDRRRASWDDFLSAFLADAAAKGELSPMEIIVQVVTLIVGGTDTTRVAMASQTSLLLQHRAQWDAVCADPALVRNAVTEALRFEPSVASVARVTLEDVAIGDKVVPAGQFLVLSALSAMRDDAVHERPDVFDIHRTDQRRLHLVFGGGAHRCIGEALAWAELEEGLSVLAVRIPQLHLAGTAPKLQGHIGIRRIGEMRVVW